MLSLTDGKRTFKLNYRQANQIELKLNVSSYKYIWKTIVTNMYHYNDIVQMQIMIE